MVDKNKEHSNLFKILIKFERIFLLTNNRVEVHILRLCTTKQVYSASKQNADELHQINNFLSVVQQVFNLRYIKNLTTHYFCKN